MPAFRALVLAATSVAALIAAPAAVALDPARAVTQYVHESWTAEQGLPQNFVSGIVQGRDGYLWVGTEEGLARFDGVRFQVLDPNTPAMRRKSIAVLVGDEEGALWFGSHGGGVVRVREGVWTAYGTTEGLASDSVRQVYVDRHGRLWASTTRGLGLLTGGRFVTYTTKDGLSADDAHPLTEDRSGNVWLGSRAGLNRWRDGRITVYTTKDGLPHDSVNAAHEDLQGRLWIGTRGGLAEWREGRFVRHPIPGGPSRRTITVIRSDRDGNLWLGTAGGGLLRFRDGRVDAFGAGVGISHVTALCEDREGSLWVGTLGGGLHRLRDGKFVVYGTPEGLSLDVVYSAHEDAEGAVWISTYGGGLNRLTAGAVTSVTTYTAKDGLRSENLGTVLGDRDRNLWISTQGGLHRLRNGRIRAYTQKEGLAETLVTALLEDRSGRIWVANSDGLHWLEGDRFRSYTTRDGLPTNYVLAMAEGRDGSLWIGTYDAGLARWKDGRFTTHVAAGLGRQPIACLYEDAEGTLWIGTFGGGLVRAREGLFIAYTTREGLFDDNVLNILEDGRKNLWLSSNRGIFRVSKEDLDGVARGALGTIRSVAYGKADGMRSAETNGGGMASKHRDGRLWFPTAKGVVVVDPERLDPNPLPPPVVVEELRANSRSVPLLQPIELAPGTATNLELHYAGLSLVAPEKVAFRYRLEGLDEGWVEAGTRRVAYFTNLAPGRYRFRVKACNNDGIWNETGASLDFSVRPRFYQTAWFALLCGALVLLSAWGSHRVRLALAEAKAAVLEERNRIAQEIHDGVTQVLGGITMQLEAARDGIETAADVKDARRSARHVERARSLTDDALEELHRSIWALRPALLEDAELPEAVGRLVEQLDTGAGPEVTFAVDGTPAELPRELERSVLRIAQEALFNATRHGRARHVSLRLGYEPVALRLQVRDDGRGFDPGSRAATRRPGFGLRGMEERVRKLGGTLSVKSEPGAGTDVTATFPRKGGWPLRAARAALRRIAFRGTPS